MLADVCYAGSVLKAPSRAAVAEGPLDVPWRSYYYRHLTMVCMLASYPYVYGMTESLCVWNFAAVLSFLGSARAQVPDCGAKAKTILFRL